MDHATAAASSASAVAAVLWASGQPPDAVLLAALAGGVLSVWGDPPPARISPRWVVASLGRMGLSVAVGLAGAAALPVLAGGYDMLAPLGRLPQWVLSGGCSLLAPALVSAVRGWLDRLTPPAATLPVERDQ